MAVIDINDITMAYDDVGAGARAIVLVHGHPFNRSMWQPQIAALSAAGWRVIAPDLRGYGETTVVPGTTTLDVFARDIMALVTALGLEHVVVAGLSMGGQIAMEIARLYPSRVSGLILAATFPQPETDEGKRNRCHMAERLLAEGMTPYASDVLPKMLAPRSIAVLSQVAEHVLTMMRTTAPEGAAASLRGRAERPDYRPVLADFTAPALVVVGDEDAFTTRTDAERMHTLLRRSTLVWMEGVGHMPNLERPAAFNEALEAFLASVDFFISPGAR